VTLNERQRRDVLSRVLQTIDKQHVGPIGDTARLRREHEEAIVMSVDADQFEAAVNAMLRSLGTSHVGFFHNSRLRAAGRIAIAATFMKANTPDGLRWMFQDVHPGGAAARAGIRAGDVLLTIEGKEVVPPDGLPFQLGTAYAFNVRRPDRSTARVTVDVPGSKEKKRPIVVPDQVVTATKLDCRMSLIRVSMFPGVLGMDVARDISRAVADLATDRLIVDLRGNTGGGIGCLRLMSLMCPDRRGVGYSISRAVAELGLDKGRLPAFDRIPSTKIGVLPLAIRFARAKRSVAIFTEALGVQRHHGRIALIVNEHSASAAEMVAAFASEYELATLVGTTTAGRLVGTSGFKVGFGYRLALPVAAYYTWKGTNLEGRGVSPDVEVPTVPEAVWRGEDTPFLRARLCLAAKE